MPPANAAACTDEEGDFAQSVNGQGGTPELSYGDENTFILKNRTLSTCSKHLAGSTAHVIDTAYDQTEAGYTEGGASGSGTHNFYLFWEVTTGGVVTGSNEDSGQLNGTPPQGTGWTFKVVYASGPDDWHYFVNPNDGSGWTNIYSGPNCGTDQGACATGVGFRQVTAEGETVRFGGTGTGATDHHYNLLQWNKAAQQWQSWDWAGFNSAEVSQDGLHIAGYHYCPGATQYYLEPDGTSCP